MASSAVTTITRPLDAEERDLLDLLARDEGIRELVAQAAWFMAFIGILVFGGITTAWRLIYECDCDTNPRPAALAIALALGALASRSMWREAWTRWRAGTPDSPAARDLSGGVAAEFTARVRRVVEIVEYEDEGTGFFLELEDGRVLTLMGQEFYDYAHDDAPEPGEPPPAMVFPAEEITYSYAPESQVTLRLRTAGARLRPIGLVRTTRAHFQPRQGSLTLPFNGEIEDGPLERVIARHRYVLEPMPG